MFPAYEQMLEAIYRSFLRSGDVVVDIGAHMGRHALSCAEIIGPKGKVFCFEPLPLQFQALSDLVQQRQASETDLLPEMKLFNFALGESECETAMYGRDADNPLFYTQKRSSFSANTAVVSPVK